MLFADAQRLTLNLPATDKAGKPATIAYLIDYLCEKEMKDTRQELFVLEGHL
jgi:ubiquitin related modifier 1